MGSPSTNGSASREVGGGAWCWRDTPHPLGGRNDLMLDQWERITWDKGRSLVLEGYPPSLGDSYDLILHK